MKLEELLAKGIPRLKMRPSLEYPRHVVQIAEVTVEPANVPGKSTTRTLYITGVSGKNLYGGQRVVGRSNVLDRDRKNYVKFPIGLVTGYRIIENLS